MFNIALSRDVKDRLKIGQLVVVSVSIVVSAYCAVTFTSIPYISSLRDIWIETAMTTGDHQWLATLFFPKSVIDNVTDNKVDTSDIVSITTIDTLSTVYSNEFEMTKLLGDGENNGVVSEEVVEKDILKQQSLGDTDEFGNTVLINDIEQSIVGIEVSGISYKGKLLLIDDASRITVKNTSYRGDKGELLVDFLNNNNAVLGVNANGFSDDGGNGTGGLITGCSLSDGEEWGDTPKESNTTIGFDNYNRLVVGNIDDWEKYKLRDAAQFGPLLISNGKALLDGSAGYGLQPRTIVGQRSDGVVAFLVIDGRQPGHSLGITYGDAVAILQQYGIVNAAACDGGSSSTLAYNGSIINRPSTPLKTGRYLPNALLVSRK